METAMACLLGISSIFLETWILVGLHTLKIISIEVKTFSTLVRSSDDDINHVGLVNCDTTARAVTGILDPILIPPNPLDKDMDSLVMMQSICY